MEGLSLDNILDVDSNALFAPAEEVEDINSEDSNEETTEEQGGELFAPESVSSEEDIEVSEEDTSSKKSDDSPKQNLYSSLATALKEDGIFPDLDDLEALDIKSSEDFAYMIEKQVQAKLEEKQKRIDEALNANIEVSVIKQYENVINYLDSISDEVISEESENGETLRKQLIYQDFINNGFSKERAEREVKKSLNAGTDVEDAKEALLNNKKHFESQYDNLIKEGKENELRIIEQRKKEAEALKKSILEDDKVFGELVVDKNTRKKVFDNLSKPIYKDPDTGDYLTAIQKYERENKVDFLKNLSLIFTLTNGFKDMNGLVQGKVNKEMKKKVSSLEKVINSSSRTIGGDLKFVTGVKEDPESYLNGKWSFDDRSLF